MMNDKESRQTGTEGIHAESDDYARQWRRQTSRIGVGILVGAFLFLIFSPETAEGYLAASLFIAPIFLVAAKEPRSARLRTYACLTCTALSLAVYFALVA